MILFKEDWGKHPGSKIDILTTNTSFLRLAGLYKKMGIKNHSFLLSILDADLIEIDPFSEDLSDELIEKIALECKLNYWYFIREVARIPPTSGTDSVMYKANRGNIATSWIFMSHITNILIQIRQTGKSITNDVITTWLTKIACVNTEINLLTKDRGLRQKNMARVKNIGELLPGYLQLKDRNDVVNTEMLSVSLLGNTFIGHVPRTSPRDAIKVGRGMSSGIAIIDEPVYQPNIEIAMPAALAAGGAARDLAKTRGEPYGTMITTTVGDVTDPSGRYIYTLIANSAQWLEKYLDAPNYLTLTDLVRTNSPKGRLRITTELNHRQLGYSDDWMRLKLEDMEADVSDKAKIAADMFNIWMTGGSTSPIGEINAKAMKASVEDPSYIEITDYSYVFKWYLPEEQVDNALINEEMVLGVDTSDGVGSDDIAMHLRRVSSGDTVGVGLVNETNLITYAEWLFSLLVKYPKIVLVIERRSSGVMIIDFLLKMFISIGVNPFTRIFNWVVQDFESKPVEFKEVSTLNKRDPVYIKYKKEFGYATSGSGRSSRDNLYGNALRGGVKYTSAGVKDLILCNQLLGLVVRNGRVDHPNGGNDDLCIAWLLSYWFLINARNLQFYGISSSNVLSGVKKRISSELSGEATYDTLRQREIRAEILVICKALKTTKDDYVANALERNLRAISSELKLNSNEKFNVDTLVDDLNIKRKR